MKASILILAARSCRWNASLAGLLLGLPLATSAEEPILLREKFVPGYQYHVSTRTELSGALTVPPMKDQKAPATLTVTGNSSVEYDERVLSVQSGGRVDKTARIFRRIDFVRRLGDRTQQNTIRPSVRRLIILRLDPLEVPFSPDGPLTWGEIDLVRTDVFTPALAGLLSDKAVTPGATWTAATSAIQELTDMERIEEGKVECRLEQVNWVQKRRQARVAFAGAVRGINEDGPNRQELEGYFYFDLESNHLSYLYLKGVSSLLDKDGKAMGRVEGQFILTRQAPQSCKELADEAIKGITLTPNAGNTELLFEDIDLGVRFLYPRRWRVAAVQGRQVAVDETKGSGLLITLEPANKVPTGTQFQAEVRAWLAQQKAKVFRVDQVRRLEAAPREREHFAIDAELASQRVLMDYYVVRQEKGGATLAARLLPKDSAALQGDVDRLSRTLTITRPVPLEDKKPN
jgi:hypothetical protein